MNNNSTAKKIIFTALYAFLVLSAISVAVVLSIKFPRLAVLITVCASVIFAGLTVLLVLLTDMLGRRSLLKKQTAALLTTIMYDKINQMTEPAVVCDSHGRIKWANKYTKSVFGSRSILNVGISTVFSYELKDDKNRKKAQSGTVLFDGKKYIVEKTEIKTTEQSYYLLVLRDVTKKLELEQFIKDDEKVVAYIIVDNLEDLLQFEQERYREAAAKIESLIREWGESVGGIVKEYERDKYLFIFNSEDLDKFIENKFEILDRIRDVRVSSSNIPVTVSMGVAKVKGTLSEKERNAHIALDMALQRGGDQAVVKLDGGIDFFGGRTNTVQKRLKVRARVFANELASRIANAGNVIVMAHAYPDYDAFGASVGAAKLAMFCGVKVNIVTNSKDPNIRKCLKHFAGDETYKNIFVDAAKGLDLVRSDTLLIIVDVNNINMFESKDLARNVDDIIIIDHHRKTAEFDKEPIISYIETSSSSASELMAEILEQALPPKSLSQVEADMLYAGILLDTKHFTKGTGTKTHAAAMYLRDNGASYESVQDLFKTNLNDYKREAVFGEKIQIYRNCMAIALNKNGQDASDRVSAARVADNLLMLEDVVASFALVKIGDTVHISARSNGTINVQLILEELNGGGRYDTAGAQVKDMTAEAVLDKLKQAIDNYINPEV